MPTETEISRITPTAPEPSPFIKVLACDTHPITIAGLRALLNMNSEFFFAEAADSLSYSLDFVRENELDVLIVDKAFGMLAISEWLGSVRESRSHPPVIVVWDSAISEADAMHLVRAGVRGILRKTAEVSALLACLRAVSLGKLWIDECVFRSSIDVAGQSRTALTSREQQVFELVEQGLTNKEIGRALGIQPGTVKIHLKHIFEKTGIRGRYSLALAGFADVAGTNAVTPKAPRAHSATA